MGPRVFSRTRAVSLLAAAALLALGTTSAQAAAVQPSALQPLAAESHAQAVAEAMQPGWNLGNSFDAVGADETAWGNPVVTRALITHLAAQGFRSIRIPATWGQHEGAAPTYTIDPTFLGRVRTVVDWALSAGLYVQLDMHHDSWMWVTNMPTQHDAVLAQFKATWTQLAATFKNRSTRLLFEPINEQSFTGSSGDAQSYSLMNELNTTFYSVVRSSGGNNAVRPLVLPTLYTNGDQARLDALATTITALKDPNLLATIHYYGYWPFSTNIAGTTTFDATTQQDITDTIDRSYTTFVAKGIPVIIGEYGLLGFDKSLDAVERGETLKFFEYFGYYARTHHITTMLWDNGQHFDRTNFVWKDPDLFAEIKASWTTRSGTASTDQVFVDKTTGPTAETVTLNLNGTSFRRLTDGSRELRPGIDYTLSGNQLTFPAAAVNRYTGTKAYGVNSTLTATFSAGAPWKLNFISYDTPVLQNATGTTSLVIPTAFRGDRLATMEAAYPDGSGAGPQNWTTYKEFDSAFTPDYTANTITLPTAFFAAVNDGTVNLTFHFWSGTLVHYTLVKSGASVTGTVG
jgi:endoglucanase